MGRVLLLQIDGSTPNLALMRIAAHHLEQGDAVEFRNAPTVNAVESTLFDKPYSKVYASAIFERSQSICKSLLAAKPNAIVGGTGWNRKTTLADIGVSENVFPDYSIYPSYSNSIGFTQRGCRLKCSFCVVPEKEGSNREVNTIADIWRGEPWPRNILLLDNDFFGQPHWRERIDELNAGKFKVCWNQGFNVRLIGDEEAAAIATTDYRDDQFKVKRLYTAWDNRKDEERLFRNLGALVRHGVNPDNIMVYMLIAYWHRGELHPDDFHRHQRLREFGCRPYPMPFVRTPETRGFQRWIVGAYDKRVTWEQWVKARYEPRNITPSDDGMFEEQS